VAVVRQEGKIVAFANIWAGAGEELSIDLMRHRPDAAQGIMEFLFIALMLWGKDQGYRWFNLGMVPLAGLEDRSLAPFWNRLGAQVFRHGEHFYNFQGLRQFKEHFDPQWRPKYLISPGGFMLPYILANIASLISGGLKGAITK
jgi:phosphatidylglycerol lysyltransferase